MMSWSFLTALIVDVIGLLVALYFVLSDSIRYGRSNGSLGMVTLVFSGWLGCSYYLYHHGHPSIAASMAWMPAVPLIGYGLFVLLFILLKPDMR